jgi:hypothetical protein
MDAWLAAMAHERTLEVSKRFQSANADDLRTSALG